MVLPAPRRPGQPPERITLGAPYVSERGSLWVSGDTYGERHCVGEASGTSPHGSTFEESLTDGSRMLVSSIPGQKHASPPTTQGGSPVRELRPPGSVRGVTSNGYSYRDDNKK